MSTELPEAHFTHVDASAAMNQIATEKYATVQLSRVKIVQEHIQRIRLPPEQFDLIVCVNVLYGVPPQRAILQRIRDRWGADAAGDA